MTAQGQPPSQPGEPEPSRWQRYLEQRLYPQDKRRGGLGWLLVPLGLLMAAAGGVFWYATSADVQQCASSLVQLANQAACANDALHHTLGAVGFFGGLAIAIIGAVLSRR